VIVREIRVLFINFDLMNNYSQKTYTVEEATSRLESYCAYQERCHKEVQQKLREMKMIPEAAELILLHLLKHNFLNESRFAQAFARGKFNHKKWGKQRIVRELKFRDISKYNINLGLKEISEEDYNNTFNILAKKRLLQLSSEKNLQKKRKKFTDYLLYRGWESFLVYDKVRELIK
jgi:regulatory protein